MAGGSPGVGAAFRVDLNVFKRTCRKAARSHARIAFLYREIAKHEGRVLVSKRNRMTGDPKGRVLHGKGIANIMREKHGRDPFAIPSQVIDRAGKAFDRAAVALTTAAGHRRISRDEVKAAYLAAAEILTDWVVHNIESGGLGGQSAKLRRSKEIGLSSGRTTSQHTSTGGVPPWGIRSARFVRGIRAGVGRTISSVGGGAATVYRTEQ